MKSYISKKGENLATIEDTKKITSELEKVKLQYEFMREKDKVIKSLTAERMTEFNLKKDKLLFDIYNKGNLLIEKSCNLTNDMLGIQTEHELLFNNYVAKINIDIGQFELDYTMAITIFKDENLTNSIIGLGSPLYQVSIRLNEISRLLIDKNSSLNYRVVNGNYKYDTIENAEEFINYKYKLFDDYIRMSFDYREKYRVARELYVREIIRYYEGISSQLDNTIVS